MHAVTVQGFLFTCMPSCRYHSLLTLMVHWTPAFRPLCSAIHYSPDGVGINGVHLGMDVATEAGEALTKAMVKIAPQIMTTRQLAAYGISWIRRRLGDTSIKRYSPAFAESVQHFLIHAGAWWAGRMVQVVERNQQGAGRRAQGCSQAETPGSRGQAKRH